VDVLSRLIVMVVHLVLVTSILVSNMVVLDNMSTMWFFLLMVTLIPVIIAYKAMKDIVEITEGGHKP